MKLYIMYVGFIGLLLNNFIFIKIVMLKMCIYWVN